jgi:hypothetical protein
MKANKSQKEAVLRAHQSIENDQQDQEKLYRPIADKVSEGSAENINQSHHRKMQNYHNLRKMDEELHKKKKAGK